MKSPAVSTAAPIRGRAFRPALLIAALAFLLPACTQAGDEVELRDPDAYFFTQTFGDLPEELAAARESGKQGMLLFFEADACPYCQHMRRKVFSSSDVQDWFRQHFVNIAVDIHGIDA